MSNTYLWINIGTLLFPLLLSFDKKVAFYKNWKFLLPSIVVTAFFFLGWDFLFTELNVWGFNHIYVKGIYWFNMPMEEWLFFATVPYACVFIYECWKAYFPRKIKPVWGKWVAWILLLISGFLLLLFHNKLYTAITMLLLVFMLLLHLVVFRRAYLVDFFITFLISIIPMLVVNGILTSKPVVWYNSEEFVGNRVFSIPVEDFFYNMAMLLMVVGTYEMIKRWFTSIPLHHHSPQTSSTQSNLSLDS